MTTERDEMLSVPEMPASEEMKQRRANARTVRPRAVDVVVAAAQTKKEKPAAPSAPTEEVVPRVVEQSERGSRELLRYRIRSESPSLPPKYVLARSEDEARDEYLRIGGLQPEATLTVVELSD